MINSFAQYLDEEGSVAYYTFGRMNPPTVGHEKLLNSLAKKAGRNDYFVYLSQTSDSKKNPLDYNNKVKSVRKLFPRHARRIMVDKKVRTAFDAASQLYDKGYQNLVMVVGDDRVREFKTILEKYNGQKGNHGFYNFKSIEVMSAGTRDPDAEGVEGMSASKMRQFASDNEFTSFAQGLPPSTSNRDSRKLFNDVRSGMGLKEETEFKRHVELESVSEEREQFIKGDLFSLGDKVIVKESDEMGVITYLGANYVLVELSEDNSVRKWLNAVEKVEEVIVETISGPDIKRAMTQRTKRYK
jgi:hypothetical protein